jgi:aminopeptidase
MSPEAKSPLVTPTYTPTVPLTDDDLQLVYRAQKYVRAILHDSLHLQPSERLYILYDEDVELTKIIASAYATMGEEHEKLEFTHFHQHTPEEILEHLATLKANDCVVLIQSQQFRLNEYRLRLELFKRNIKTIEHVHLNIVNVNEYKNYVESLAFSPVKYRPLALRLKEKIDKCQHILVSFAFSQSTLFL